MPNSMSRYAADQPENSLTQVSSTNSPADVPLVGFASSRGPSDITLGIIAISLPLLIFGAAITRRRYRALTLQRRIERLEKIWRINCKSEI